MYVLKEHLAPLFATLGTLTGVLLLGYIIKFAELIIAKGVSPFDVLRLLIYLIPYMLSFTIPMACLIAIVMALGRLSTDYELIAMRASGVAPFRLIWPVLIAGLIISALLLLMNHRVVPEAHLAFRRQLQAIGIKQPGAYIESGTFIKAFPPYTIFVYQVDGEKLTDVRIYEPQEDGPTRTIVAERGTFEPSADRRGVRLLLEAGTMDEWDPAQPGKFSRVAFDRYAMDLKAEGDDPRQLQKKLKEMTFHELLQERGRLAAQGIDPTPVSLEFHRKIAASFSTLVFVAFGLALGLRLHHHERLISFVWILGIFLCYYLLSIGMNAVALKGWLAAWLTMWIPNVVGIAVGGVMVARAVRH